jgi:Zc3h12a-like Ribonuclease NYN domain/S1 RNA binding domain
MAPRHVVVDGSNLATEGRSTPSLAQLDQAVREFVSENPGDIVTVVVDASFGHRIDPSERTAFEEAEAAGELVSPPAGAIGRGDAFLLRIADKTSGTVLSNDSFQEFHGEHPWLFDKGRLIGGKPVPGVGWIFTPRSPVRGPKSRDAVKEAKSQEISGLDLAAEQAQKKKKGKRSVERAIAAATEEAVAPKDGKVRRRRKAGHPPAEPVNEPLAFLTFVAGHPLGSEVAGEVDAFTSHGAFVDVEGAKCYVPLSGLGDPPPKSAREVLTKGETARFVLQALDPQRRGIELALPDFARVAGVPTDETVEAEIAQKVAVKKDGKRAPAKKAAAAKKAPAQKAAATKKAVKKVAAAKPGPAKKAPVVKEAAPVKKAATKREPAKKQPGKKAAVKKAAPAPAPARKAAAKKASPSSKGG